jgi:pyruvate dehydrogenase E2 component (dihydrolipoamide acetyltransferase)
MAEIIEMPKLSDTMTTGTLVKWLKQEGDTVKAGEMIAEIETDKATMDVENFEDGVVLKLYAEEGAVVAIGDPICAIGKKGEAAPDIAVKAAAAPPPEDDVEAEADATEADEGVDKDKDVDKDKEEDKDADRDGVTVAPADKGAAPSVPSPAPAVAAPAAAAPADGRVRISPLARKLASEHGIDLASIKGSGPDGRIVKADVLATARAPRSSAPQAFAAPAAAGALEEKQIPVSNMRAAIARALVASKSQAPHFYLQSEIDGGPVADLRQALNEQGPAMLPGAPALKITINDIILRAAALAVLRVPEINRSWNADKIIQHGTVHLAFGVAIEDGLLTPVIRDAQNKSLRQISAEAAELIGRARARKLKPEEMSASTLTVTNLGMFGITDFYGILNPPNAAILSVGATIAQPVVDAAGRIVVGRRMKIGLSGDHRVIDGVTGARYLAALRTLLESPALLLL